MVKWIVLLSHFGRRGCSSFQMIWWFGTMRMNDLINNIVKEQAVFLMIGIDYPGACVQGER